MAKKVYVYDGTTWVEATSNASVPTGTTGNEGIVRLTDSITSTSTSTAATPNSVRSLITSLSPAAVATSASVGVETTAARADHVHANQQSLSTTGTPTFATVSVTGNIDAASFDKVTITAPATSATLTIANTKALTVSNTLTLTGTDTSSVDVGSGGSLTPAGVVQAYLGAYTSIPSGWLLCDGAAVSRTTYAALFGVISTTYGAGNGSTTFNLPNLAGHMLVGYNTGTPGTAQQTGTGDSYANATWDHNHTHSHITNPAATTSGGPSTLQASITTTGSGSAGSSTHTHSTDIAATTSDTDSSAMTVSPTQKRTRVNYIVKW